MLASWWTTRQGCPLSPPLCNTELDILTRALREDKEKHCAKIRKEVKLSLLISDTNIKT